MRPPHYPLLEERAILEVIEARKWGISTRCTCVVAVPVVTRAARAAYGLGIVTWFPLLFAGAATRQLRLVPVPNNVAQPHQRETGSIYLTPYKA